MFVIAHLVPTGVGAAIGGFAGDAGPAARVLAAVCDRLVTHPNAVNGADLSALPPGALYVEGRALDGWLAGRTGLLPDRPQRIGILIDAAVTPATLDATLNAANAVRAVHGVDVVGYHLTAEPLGCQLGWANGVSTGEVARPEALLDGARRLVAAGATAIAILADLGDYDDTAYRQGRGVDPIGGLEAILSHLVVSELGIPAAHAPLMPLDLAPQPLVDPRAAAEYIGHTYLPCVLLGLARHPGLARPDAPGALPPASLVVVPAGCLGGPGVLAAVARGIPVIAVAENATVLAVTAEALGLPAWPAANYLEAAGMAAALRAGVDWRACRRPLASVLKIP
ncbi:MAG: hypothetical protein JWM80_4028 [Cyanobacteria bacterium RYN_339]|nr:hypothetical protein [Cyanobacteria bacterium RYN_339]